jgi:TRAP-type C4-dicarboxylate transport system permease small subunit
MGKVDKAAEAIASVLERVLAVALVAGIVLNFVNVVGRYLSGYTLIGADEIEIYILIWIAFLGAAVVTWRGDHLRMDVLLAVCPPIVRKAVAVAEACVMLAVTSFVAVQSLRYVERIYALGAVSDIARVPTWFPHSAVFICFATMALIMGVRLVQRLARLAVPHGQVPKQEAHR